jgi:alpha-amylase
MGFDAIWITPVIENTPQGYHGYWAKDFDKTNPYHGTEEELKELVNECHKRDMLVMVDVVANHIGYVNQSQGFKDNNYSGINPFNKNEHYHPYCELGNKKDKWHMENCFLMELPDLNTEHPFVRSYLMKWIKNLI